MCKHVVFCMFKHISFDIYINIFICKQIDTSSTIKKKEKKKKAHYICIVYNRQSSSNANID